MATSDAAEPTQNPSASTSKNKKNKKKKKAAAAKAEGNGSAPAVNGVEQIEADDGDDAEEEPESPVKESTPTVQHPESPTTQSDGANGTPSDKTQDLQNKTKSSHSNTIIMSDDPSERLDALARERDTLRAEVTELRKSLETIQSKHEEDTAGLKEQLEETQNGKDQAETQYRNLLGKVNTIRSQLGERLKQDAEDLAQARTQIEQLEEQNRSVNEENESLQEDVLQLRKANENTASEVAELRNRSTVSQQNWIQERDELIQREAFVKEEYDNARQAMQDWEILAMEERSLRENLGERVSELEEQLSSTREAYESAAADRDAQVSKFDTLQRRVQEEHDARKKELRELVEQSQSQLETLRKQLQAAEEDSAASKETLESTQKELERALPFEKEVKEKNLLIGKLRHEAVILNDHLKKALRLLRKGKPEDNVDRNIVTNHFLHFLALDRSDPKKFQILQLIAALLNWNDEQREQAGLARPGASNTSLRVPLSPFRRTPSTPSLNADTLLMNESSNKESLAELWSNFLEHEALEGSPALSRRESVASPSSDEPPKKGKDRTPSTSSGLGIS